MRTVAQKLLSAPAIGICAAALSLMVVLVAPSGARADEADAKRLLKAMSDYLASQKVISFDYDATFEVITKENQRLALAASGTININRPDKIRATRFGGHADIELLFDGKTLTLLGKNKNLYTQIEVPGTIDNLVDVLREKYNRPLPAADLVVSNPYSLLMDGVTNIKDLGSGVVDGVECDYLAFRKEPADSKIRVDFQIWIAQGANPYPCRFVIASQDIPHAPQYTVQVKNWKSDDFGFKNATKAKNVSLKDLQDAIRDLPKNYRIGAAQ